MSDDDHCPWCGKTEQLCGYNPHLVECAHVWHVTFELNQIGGDKAPPYESLADILEAERGNYDDVADAAWQLGWHQCMAQVRRIFPKEAHRG
jgi:hypothetical protein